MRRSKPVSTCYTCELNIRHQQNLTTRELALLILSLHHWLTLRRVAARIATAVDFVPTGQIVSSMS